MPPDGRLPVTYDDFVRYGLHRDAIYPALQEVVALGFVEITERGVAGGPNIGRPPNLGLPTGTRTACVVMAPTSG